MAGRRMLWRSRVDLVCRTELIGDIDATEQLSLTPPALYSDTSIGCFTKGTPNAAYGYGR